MPKLFFINGADYKTDAIAELKEAIRNLNAAGTELAEGSLCDLARIFNRIIWTYEHEGIDTVVKIYWSREAERKH